MKIHNLENIREKLEFIKDLIDPKYDHTGGVIGSGLNDSSQKKDLITRYNRIQRKLRQLDLDSKIEDLRRRHIDNQLSFRANLIIDEEYQAEIPRTHSKELADRPSNWDQMSKNQKRRWRKKHYANS